MSTHDQSVAIVICTRDRPTDLVRCLASLEDQSVQPDEVLIVLGSPESCPPNLADRTKLPIRHIESFEHNISKARNAGISAATSALVLFIDDDAQARDGWIQAYLNAFDADPASWAIGGDVYDSRPSPPSQAAIEFSRGLISPTGRQIPISTGSLDTQPRGYVQTVKGCNFAIRRQQVIELGGFDPFFAFGFDESDLMLTIQAAGARVVHEPKAAVDHAHTPGHFRQTHPLDRDWRV